MVVVKGLDKDQAGSASTGPAHGMRLGAGCSEAAPMIGTQKKMEEKAFKNVSDQGDGNQEELVAKEELGQDRGSGKEVVVRISNLPAYFNQRAVEELVEGLPRSGVPAACELRVCERGVFTARRSCHWRWNGLRR